MEFFAKESGPMPIFRVFKGAGNGGLWHPRVNISINQSEKAGVIAKLKLRQPLEQTLPLEWRTAR